jgi:hypothetical protein
MLAKTGVRMLRTFFVSTCLMVALHTTAVQAQDLEEIIVTGSRAYNLPAVTLVKRADFMIQELRITNDTRQEQQREQEIYETIAGLLKKAKATNVFTLGTGEAVFTPLTTENYRVPLEEDDDRDDASQTYILIKAPLKQDASPNQIADSIRDFIRNAKMVGRTEVEADDELGLSILNPERYRYELIDLVAADAKRTASAFGPEYRLHIRTFDEPLQWQRQGLDAMALYIPYKFDIVPAGDPK